MTTPGPGGIAADQLRTLVERIERLEEERKSIADDIREIYTEAKGVGFDVKVLRNVIRRRRADANERQEFDALLDLYEHALGMAGETPDMFLGETEDDAPHVPLRH